MNFTKRKIPAVFGMIIVIGVGAVLFFQYQNQKRISPPPHKEAEIGDQTCVTKTEEKIVRGNSLSGVLEDGTAIKILFGYYECNEVKINDVVAYQYAGNPRPIVKIVKALARDTFHLEKSQDIAGWNILVNSEILKNSQGKPYLLDDRGYRLLLLYEQDYKGMVPENTYLLLGNIAIGTTDSTQFGLVSKIDIIGKVVLP